MFSQSTFSVRKKFNSTARVCMCLSRSTWDEEAVTCFDNYFNLHSPNYKSTVSFSLFLWHSNHNMKKLKKYHQQKKSFIMAIANYPKFSQIAMYAI